MKLFFLFMCVLLSTAIGHAQSYYVSHLGTDANPGTLTRPFRTIQKALNTATSGSIFVRSGVYNEKLTWKFSGTSSSSITLSNYNGETVIVDGTNAGVNTALLQIMDKSNLVISGITFRNNILPYAKGIYILGSGTNVQIRDCAVEKIGWTTNAQLAPTKPEHNANGIIVVGSRSVSYSNIAILRTAIRFCQTGTSEALTVAGNVDGFRIENNWVHNITNIGIDVAGHYAWTKAPDNVNQARNGVIRNNYVFGCIFPANAKATAGIYSDGARDIIIEQNRSYNNSVGISVGCENANRISTRITVRNNFIYNNLHCGVYFGSNASGSWVEESRLFNNTFFRNASDPGWLGEIHLQNSRKTQIFQNIVSTRTGKKAMIALLGYVVEAPNIWCNLYHNESNNPNDVVFDWGPLKKVYTSLALFQQATGFEYWSLFANPQFLSNVNPVDLHLRTNSPAINRGELAYIPKAGEQDIDGQARRQGSSVDIGADETVFTTAAISTLLAKEFNVFPNPVKDRFFIDQLPNEVQEIFLMDALGRPVKYWKLKNLDYNSEFPIGDLLPGNYFLILKGLEVTITRTIIKI